MGQLQEGAARCCLEQAASAPGRGAARSPSELSQVTGGRSCGSRGSQSKFSCSRAVVIQQSQGQSSKLSSAQAGGRFQSKTSLLTESYPAQAAQLHGGPSSASAVGSLSPSALLAGLVAVTPFAHSHHHPMPTCGLSLVPSSLSLTLSLGWTRFPNAFGLSPCSAGCLHSLGEGSFHSHLAMQITVVLLEMGETPHPCTRVFPWWHRPFGGRRKALPHPVTARTPG